MRRPAIARTMRRDENIGRICSSVSRRPAIVVEFGIVEPQDLRPRRFAVGERCGKDSGAFADEPGVRTEEEHGSRAAAAAIS